MANFIPVNFIAKMKFDAEKDIPTLSSKVFLITGGISAISSLLYNVAEDLQAHRA